MEIRYLTPPHNAQAGDIPDIPEAQAHVLILLKIAEKVEKTPKKAPKTTQKG